MRLIYPFYPLVALWWALTPLAVHAQDVGLALFALPSPRFPCESALKAFKAAPKPAVALLYGTFGKDRSCLERFIHESSDRPHLVEVHITNEACRRNKRCTESDFLAELSVKELNKKLTTRDPAVMSAYVDLIKEITGWISPLQSAKTEFIISTGLEDNFSLQAYRVVLELLKAHWDGATARSAVGSPTEKPIEEATYSEGHGVAPQFLKEVKCIANLDGDDMTFPHRSATTKNRISWLEVKSYVEEFKARCRVTFLWSAPWQGIHSDTFIPPAERQFLITPLDLEAIAPLLMQ